MTWRILALGLVAGAIACESPGAGSAGAIAAAERLVLDPRADQDGDGVPDLVEAFAGSDPRDKDDEPKSEADVVEAEGARGRGACPTGWRKLDMLCMSHRSYRPAWYASAVLDCRGMEWYYGVPIRVATYEDLSSIYLAFPQVAADYNPKGAWLGHFVDDDRVLCGNRNITGPEDGDIDNFEGECNKKRNRWFWCVMHAGLYGAARGR